MAAGYRTEALPRWATLVAILSVILTGAGGVIAAANPSLLVAPHSPMNDAARVYTGYTLSRDLSIAIAIVVLLALRARRGLGGMLLVVALIQTIDIAVDAASGRLALVPGLGVLVLVLLSAAWQLTKPTPPLFRAQTSARRGSHHQPGT